MSHSDDGTHAKITGSGGGAATKLKYTISTLGDGQVYGVTQDFSKFIPAAQHELLIGIETSSPTRKLCVVSPRVTTTDGTTLHLQEVCAKHIG